MYGRAGTSRRGQISRDSASAGFVRATSPAVAVSTSSTST
jgi:hypothetical protein